MDHLIQEKIQQAIRILREKEIDLWLTFVRETSAVGDPVLHLIYGPDLTWQSALILTQKGESIAIVGHFEYEAAQRTGAYSQVIPYHQSIRAPLLDTLTSLNPTKIAINYSKNDVHADGLSFGLYQVLLDYLNGTPYLEKLHSAESVIAALRSRKTQEEIRRIKEAVRITEVIYKKTFTYAKSGMTEKQIGEFMQRQMTEFEVTPSWHFENCPAVNTGPESPIGHAGPTALVLEPGHILHFDFGVRYAGYCSDIQRVAYILKPGEYAPPDAVQRGFDTIVKAIQDTVASIHPGMRGREVDEITRRVVTTAGYPEYMYATGHHLGRTTHDGAGILGPEWERYGDTPNYQVEPGHVYTIEPGLAVPGYGYLGLEEDIVITEDGAEYLGNPQTKIVLLK